jgi:hypothetical protein
MQAPFRFLVVLAVLLHVGSIVSCAAAADSANAATGCLYRDAHYGTNAVICVAPGFAQLCDKDNTWKPPAKDPPYNEVCANAKISIPGTPPAQCTYHDVKYAIGATICVGPNFGLSCNDNGSWDRDPNLKKACDHAQIPAPTYPASPKP